MEGEAQVEDCALELIIMSTCDLAAYHTPTGSVKKKTTTVFSRFFNTCQKSEQTQIIKNVELFKIRILIYDVVYVIFAPS